MGKGAWAGFGAALQALGEALMQRSADKAKRQWETQLADKEVEAKKAMFDWEQQAKLNDPEVQANIRYKLAAADALGRRGGRGGGGGGGGGGDGSVFGGKALGRLMNTAQAKNAALFAYSTATPEERAVYDKDPRAILGSKTFQDKLRYFTSRGDDFGEGGLFPGEEELPGIPMTGTAHAAEPAAAPAAAPAQAPAAPPTPSFDEILLGANEQELMEMANDPSLPTWQRQAAAMRVPVKPGEYTIQLPGGLRGKIQSSMGVR